MPETIRVATGGKIEPSETTPISLRCRHGGHAHRRCRASHRRGHRPAPAADPQRLRQRRDADVGRRGRAASTCSPTTSRAPRLDLERYEPEPGRASLVARIEGRDPTAPTLLLMGHTDVVPVNPDGWRRDPFGGELVDGEVWGRGAVDMLNLTASMAVATRHLARVRLHARRARSSTSPSPTRRRSGAYGAEWLVDHERDAIGADYVITESGGIPIPSPERAQAAGDRGREGLLLVSTLRVQRHARSRLAALPHRQRARSPRPRSCAGSTASSPRPRSTTCGAGSSRRWATRPRSPTRCSSAGRLRRDARRASRSAWPASSTPARTRRSRRRSSDGGTKINVIPDIGRARGRHPHAAGPDRRRRGRVAGRGAR